MSLLDPRASSLLRCPSLASSLSLHLSLSLSFFCHCLLVDQVPVTALIADFTGFHLMESSPPEQDFTGILWALAVPIISATINIITRQVENNSTEYFWWIFQCLSSTRQSTCTIRFLSSGSPSADLSSPSQDSAGICTIPSRYFCFLSQVRFVSFKAKSAPVKVPIRLHHNDFSQLGVWSAASLVNFNPIQYELNFNF